MNRDSVIDLSATAGHAHRESRQGYEMLWLSSAEVNLGVVPALGAKVISLVNRRSGREWMSFPGSARQLFGNHLGDDFARSPIAGWDECLPTIAACDWAGIARPDHGEVWSIPWQLDEVAWDQKRIVTQVRLPLTPFQFERALTLCGSCVTVDYTLTNCSEAPQPYLWSMHPLLALAPGDQLELPDEAAPLLRNEPWLASLEFPPAANQCGKVFVHPLRVGRAAVFNPRTGDRLGFEWDATNCNTLGIWLTRGGWNGQHHFALEPGTSPHDSLAEAARAGQCPVLSPHETRSWSVRLELSCKNVPPKVLPTVAPFAESSTVPDHKS